ncbi:hypothetical protein [Blastococcus sp. Marseille-P5729]|uniref:hypothetical protein n=1 Tax=Blastococcus sp. Marseille-P5729 TaxID=2086582 RepID=UPI00131E7F28|nr:hypothetical protein [Blastococcus sp. Marseille-P5729]
MRATDPVLLSRRRLLAGGAVLGAALAGCTGAPAPPPEPPRDPLEDLLDEHVALRDQYDAAIAAAPDDSRLAGMRANVDEHVAALAAALAMTPPEGAPQASASGSAAASPAPSADPATLVPALAQAELALHAHCRELAIAQRAERAPLLASLTASHGAAAGVLS